MFTAQRVWLLLLSAGIVVGWPCASRLLVQAAEEELSRAVRVSVETSAAPAPDASGIRGKLQAVLRGHTADARYVAFAPDGKSLATAGLDRTARLWDLPSGKERATLTGHEDKINGLAFAPDGKTLATAGFDGAIRLWDVAAGNELACLKGHEGWVLCVAFSPDGRTLASTGADQTVRLWDTAARSEQAKLEGHSSPVECAAFAPDGRILASGGYDGTVKLWDVAAGKALAGFQAHPDMVTGLAFTPDGKTLLTGGGPDQRIRLWDVPSGKPQETSIRQGDWLRALALSPDGKTVASTNLNGLIDLWDVGTGRHLATLKAHWVQVWSVAFSPDGKTLASASGDRTVKLWDVQPGPQQLAFDGFDEGLSLDWQIRNADLSHVSVTANPRKLTVRSQACGIYGAGRGIKNLCLVDNPAPGGDFVVTTCVEDFTPETEYQQAGLICYDDDGNYLKWGYEWRRSSEGGRTFAMVREVQQQPDSDLAAAKPGIDRYWLRVTKLGNRYRYAYSYDGQEFQEAGEQTWGDGRPKQLGILAKNGGNSEAAELDAKFDFFEVRAPSEAERAAAPSAELVREEAPPEQPAQSETAAEMTAERIEQVLVDQRARFLEEIRQDPRWSPSHEEVGVIEPVPGAGRDAVHNFCLDREGNLLVCCGGDRVVDEPDPQNPMGYRLKRISEPAEIRVVRPDGQLLRTIPLEFAPQAIALLNDGTMFVGGDGRLAHLDPSGKLLRVVGSPNLAGGDKEGPDRAAADSIEEQRKSIMESLVADGTDRAKAEEEASRIVAQIEESRKRQRQSMIDALVKAGRTQQEAESAAEDMERAQAEATQRYRRQVNGIAVTDDDLFVACRAKEGYGFVVWRLRHDLEEPVQIVDGLRGCCGQMDIQAHDGVLYVAENARHRVLRYDRQGKLLDTFGKSDRKAPEGFGGCCEPKNLRFSAAGELYACESGPPVIVRRFKPDGEFLGVVGFPTFTTGCVRVTVGVAEDGNKVFVLNVNENKIHVLQAGGKPGDAGSQAIAPPEPPAVPPMSDTMVTPPMGAPAPQPEPRAPEQGTQPSIVFTGAVIVVIPPDQTCAWAYSAETGRWRKQPLGGHTDEALPLADGSIAVVQTKSKVYAFSAITGRWDTLDLKPDTRVEGPELWSKGTAVVRFGSSIYVFSAKSGRWAGIDFGTD